MRIESKSTGKVHYVKKKDFDNYEAHKKRLYNIVDTSDDLIPSTEVEEIIIEKPKDVFEQDLKDAEIEDIKAEVEKIVEECTKSEIRDSLDEQGLEYKRDDNKSVMAEIYVKWKKTNY